MSNPSPAPKLASDQDASPEELAEVAHVPDSRLRVELACCNAELEAAHKILDQHEGKTGASMEMLMDRLKRYFCSDQELERVAREKTLEYQYSQTGMAHYGDVLPSFKPLEKLFLSALKQVQPKQVRVSQVYLDSVSLETANYIAAFTPVTPDPSTRWKAKVQLEIQRALRLMPFTLSDSPLVDSIAVGPATDLGGGPGYSVHQADCPYEHGGACTCPEPMGLTSAVPNITPEDGDKREAQSERKEFLGGTNPPVFRQQLSNPKSPSASESVTEGEE